MVNIRGLFPNHNIYNIYGPEVNAPQGTKKAYREILIFALFNKCYISLSAYYHVKLMKRTPLCTEKVQNTQEHTRLKKTASISPYCNLADDN